MLVLDPQTHQPATEQRILLHGVTWAEYTQLADAFRNTFPRMHYLDGTLELLMTTSPEHERLKKLIARLLETYAMEKRLNLNGYGNTTFRDEAVRRGAEPDECYCLGELEAYPDVVIEIALTSGGIDKLEVYAGLRVPEVWFWQDGRLRLYYRQGNTYQERTQSVLLPELDIALLSQFMAYRNQTEATIAYRDALQRS
ncbi:MAG: Uma2 family endonuclease [Cyanobacteria bacterium P01_G01_bin.54]